jgi:hypothetical protein
MFAESVALSFWALSQFRLRLMLFHTVPMLEILQSMTLTVAVLLAGRPRCGTQF